MARLRSAVKSVKDAGVQNPTARAGVNKKAKIPQASLAANISEATSKLSKSASKETPEPRVTRSTRKSKMPVPKSTTKPLPVTPVKQI